MKATTGSNNFPILQFLGDETDDSDFDDAFSGFDDSGSDRKAKGMKTRLVRHALGRAD